MSKASLVDSTWNLPPEVLSEVTVLQSEPVTIQTVVLELTVEEAAVVCALLGNEDKFSHITCRVVAALRSLPRISTYHDKIIGDTVRFRGAHGPQSVPKEFE